MSLGATFIFYGMILLTVLPAIFVPITRNAVHALLLMALSMVGVAGLYLFLEAELLAVFQLIVYVGGILVLLAMGIMVLDRNNAGKPSARSYQLWLAIPGAALLAFGLGVVQWEVLQTSAKSGSKEPISYGVDTIPMLGNLFMEKHWLAFELAGLLLLCAIIGTLYIVGNQEYGKKS
jgi:NADH:ubiquinone oxidoreductase subunit 6 (subunit J)